MAACDLADYLEDVDDEIPTGPTATVKLKDFTYSGAHTVHLALFEIEDFHGPGPIAGPNTTSQTATVESSGVHDVLFEEVSMPPYDDDYEDRQEDVDVSLLIASDEDNSGDYSTGDYVMPVYYFNLESGEELTIESLDLNTGSTLIAGPATDYVDFKIKLGYSDSLDTVDATQPLILAINDTGNPDFSAGGTFKQIPLYQTDLFEELFLRIDIKSVPDPGAPEDYYFLLFHDLNNSGIPDTGEPASENSPATGITYSETIDTGVVDNYNIDLHIDPSTTIQ